MEWCAHLHIVSTPVSLVDLPDVAGVAWDEIKSTDWISECGQKAVAVPGYLYYRSPEGVGYFASAFDLPSQTMRRWLACQLQNAEWDWRQTEIEESVIHSINWMRRTEIFPPFQTGELSWSEDVCRSHR